MKMLRMDLRNIAIIAHVDHGKTTLVDGLLRQARVFRENQQVIERVMDSNDLERERGITILSKNTAVIVPDATNQMQVKINIVDTPGHADFGGEVERVLNMVDGVVLLVDAAEGPMPQTRFVLRKALEMRHRAIVVINKVDRKDADPERALNKTFDLFVELGATDEQADFPVVYCDGLTGRAGNTPEVGADLQPLFESILRHVPPPMVDVDAPFQMLVTALGYDQYRGTTAVGRISAGKVRAGDVLARFALSGEMLRETAQYLYVFQGLDRIEVEEAAAGDIAAIAGLVAVGIGETLADVDNPVALPLIRVEEPTVRMTFGVNTSPFTGREGKWGTSRKLRERLFAEIRHNVALRVEETDAADRFVVAGRGELHLAILIETMRREGYEFEVSRPEVIFRKDEDGRQLEPYEELHVDTTPDTVGAVVEMLGARRGKLVDMADNGRGLVHFKYVVPTRGLIGLRHQLLSATRGLGVMNSLFHDYAGMAGAISSRESGSLVAWEAGDTNTYGLRAVEERGTLFMGAGVSVYEGMVVGEHQRGGDLAVNVCKKKHLTNMRASNKDMEIRLTAPRAMSLDECIEYLSDDELLEVTPDSLRIRKRVLDTEERTKSQSRARKKAVA